MGLFEVGAGNRVFVGVQRDDTQGEEVIDALARLRHVSDGHVIEAAILADDDDDVFNR
jgi:hypothetical protein